MSARPRVLVLSLSPIASDARVLKQVVLLRDDYELVTCGFGPPPEGVAQHVQIPDAAANLTPYGRYVSTRQYRRAYASIPAVAGARAALAAAGIGAGDVDVVLANDVETVPIALELRPRRGVHADLHEYAPRLHEENPAWKRWLAPFYRWICRRYVRRADSVTTVGPQLAAQYTADFGFLCGVVTNAAPYAADLTPTPVADDAPLRLVHSGAGLRNRHLEIMIDAVAQTTRPVTLDLYLTANDSAYLAQLRERASEVDGVRVCHPVPYAELVPTLHGYDVGVFVLPPVNFSYRLALPNKVFDYVQARLAAVVGPSPEMVDHVAGHRLGAVTDDFTAAALARTLDSLSADSVQQWKASAHAQAEALSAEAAVRAWSDAVTALVVDDSAVR